jgi:hypothetical protein
MLHSGMTLFVQTSALDGGDSPALRSGPLTPGIEHALPIRYETV